MAVGKVKISTTKRTKHMKAKKNVAPNQKKTKKKGGLNELKSKETVKKPGNQQKKVQKKNKSCGVPAIVNNDEIDSEIEEDILEMLELDKNSVADSESDSGVDDLIPQKKQVVSSKTNAKSAKKRKAESIPEIDDLEKEYTEQRDEIEQGTKKIKELLPIKTKKGIIHREVEVEDEETEEIVSENEEEKEEEDIESLKEDSDEEFLKESEESKPSGEKGNAISMADLLIHRENELQKQKFKIGIICSGILEQPEDRVVNFKTLFDLMGSKTKDGHLNLVSIRKIATISAMEVFKDILPDYKLGVQDMEHLKLKKTTMERVNYENVLIQQYKKYLQHLDRMTMVVSKKMKGVTEQQVALGETACHCLCELLESNPNFNFSQNIAQSMVYLSNSRFPQIRTRVNKSFRKIFTSDKRLDLTFFIVRRINHLVKSRENDVHIEVLTPLIALEIKDINLDADKEKEIKEKKLEAKKSRLINLSKKEKKRQKKLKEIEQEMLETKAEENKQSRGKKLTEIVKMIFNIYFRILKNDPGSKLLSTTLEGLAKFAHLINLEFFSDLVNVLNSIMEDEELGYRELLHCIQTVFVILSGQGEVLNIDPVRFYNHLYKLLFVVHAGKNHSDFLILVRTLIDVLLKRRKQITQQRLLAFTKRIMSVSLQLLHNGSLSCLGLIKSIMQTTSKSVDLLLDTETFIGSGRYDPELEDPEYCNANCTLLYEIAALARHYHPIVAKIAKHVAAGAPMSGEGCLNPELGKLSPDEFFYKFESSSMAFNPPIPPPNQKQEAKPAKRGRYSFADEELEKLCSEKLVWVIKSKNGEIIDFRQSMLKGKKV